MQDFRIWQKSYMGKYDEIDKEESYGSNISKCGVG